MADSEFDRGQFEGNVLAQLTQMNVRLLSIEERMIRYVKKVQYLERLSWIAIGGLSVLTLTRKELWQAIASALVQR